MGINLTRARAFVTGLLLAAALPACTQAPSRPDLPTGDYSYTKKRISERIERERLLNDVQGLSIALVDDQNVVWARGFGYQDVENRIPAGAQTVYRVGSLSKIFTVIAALGLSDRGRLDLDRPLRDALPSFSIKQRPTDSGEVTPRSLMTHHSGIATSYAAWLFVDRPFTDYVQILKEQYPIYPPNKVFHYSNAGADLLGHAIQQVSGIEFDRYMRSEILGPLDMAHSSFVLEPQIEASLSKGYALGRASEKSQLRMRDTPAAALYSSVEDMSNFIKMLFNGGTYGNRRILSEESIKEMFRLQNENVPLDFGLRVGLGWNLSDHGIVGAGTVASHGGDLGPYHTRMALLPERKLGVIVMANSDEALYAVYSIALETLKLALEEKSGLRQAGSQAASPSKSKAVFGPYDPRELVGLYNLTDIGLASIEQKDGVLRAHAMGKTFEVSARPDGQFSFSYRFLNVLPIRSIDGFDLDSATFSLLPMGERKIVVMDQGGRQSFLGEKLAIEKPVPTAWLRRAGRLRPVTPKWRQPISSLEIQVVGGVLALRYQTKYGAVFRPLDLVSESEAVVLGLGESLRVLVSKDGERLLYGGFEFEWNTPISRNRDGE